jgi:hypothetical protein
MFPQLSNLKNTIIENELMQQINAMGGDVGGLGKIQRWLDFWLREHEKYEREDGTRNCVRKDTCVINLF